jgi:hypothetical protein
VGLANQSTQLGVIVDSVNAAHGGSKIVVEEKTPLIVVRSCQIMKLIVKIVKIVKIDTGKREVKVGECSFIYLPRSPKTEDPRPVTRDPWAMIKPFDWVPDLLFCDIPTA